jgi:uncharacterized protein (UPF0335 family)
MDNIDRIEKLEQRVTELEDQVAELMRKHLRNRTSSDWEVNDNDN